ncbi:flavonol synthase/flavanone 3-hydroxylase [Ricinus communis]|uniref:Flavonol synthase, putative n=1 Tax=Ricinus communis TaxID=3988 RepID=B9S888_RICCO|nr:flavonol synthase/flavanone 3-hydroxylase [Ricinus communis]EEF40182.1 flavonol synthase, putative [Ricinus communis]|eukprot:XP_002522207.1 flavonol synthase/flavanone 3-hydroxylase [Ricinus communis]
MEVERVQALSNGGLKELPPQFVRPAHERPENTVAIDGVTVPVISMSLPHDVLVNEVNKACSEWGFFLITDHGVPLSLIQHLKEVGQEFFALPQEEKEVYANDPTTGRFEGYGTKMTKNHDEKIEWIDYFFHVIAPVSRVNYDLCPENPPSYREVTEEYKKEMVKMADELLKLLSKGLGLEENVLKSHLGDEKVELEMKINMYPPCPQPHLALGVEPHTDMSALTILATNDVPGLQVWKDDNWVAVNYLPNALFIHVGDQLQVLSNGKYKSVLHRSLVNKEKMRMSWAVFIIPPHEALIGPVAELMDNQNPPKYSTKTFAEHRYRKLNKLPQ